MPASAGAVRNPPIGTRTGRSASADRGASGQALSPRFRWVRRGCATARLPPHIWRSRTLTAYGAMRTHATTPGFRARCATAPGWTRAGAPGVG